MDGKSQSEGGEPRIAFAVREAARAAGVSVATLYALWAEGRGPRRRKLGSRTLILAEDLREWLRSLEDAA